MVVIAALSISPIESDGSGTGISSILGERFAQETTVQQSDCRRLASIRLPRAFYITPLSAAHGADLYLC